MGGLGHDFKAGVNFINEPHLFITFTSGSTDYAYTHLTNDRTARSSLVTRERRQRVRQHADASSSAIYFQDDWRVTDRLTLNLGLRYDLVTGFKFDQSANPNFQVLSRRRRPAASTASPASRTSPRRRRRTTTTSSRASARSTTCTATASDIIRGGWGIYTDFGYTNSNVLFPGLSAQGGSGVIFTATNTNGILNPDGSFFRVGQPIANIAGLNEVNPAGPFFSSNVAAPQVRQPWTAQSSLGWSHQLDASTAVDIDFVDVRGHDLGVRWPLNTKINGGVRRFGDLPLNPANPTLNMSIGSSTFDGVNFGVRRRMEHGLQLNAWYSLSKAEGFGGLGIDELTTNLVQDATQPLAAVDFGPSARTDARHKVTLSAIWQAPGGITVSPIYRYRSALPLHIWYGYDANNDGVSNDIYTTAYSYTGLNADGTAQFKDTGSCTTVNCGRGSALSQMNLRVSKGVKLVRGMNLEVYGEVFNLFNSINPAFAVGAGSSTRYYVGTAASHTVNALFLKPTAFAGDAGQPEQRVGQLGFRWSF